MYLTVNQWGLSGAVVAVIQWMQQCIVASILSGSQEVDVNRAYD